MGRSQRLRLGCLVVLLGLPSSVRATTPVEETWEVAHLDGARIGSVHTTVERLEEGKLLRTTSDLQLAFRRHGALVRLRMEHGTEETAEGKVVGVFMRQYQGSERRLTLEGKLEDSALHVQIDGGRIDRRLRWSDDVVGLNALEHLFERKKPSPGDRFTLQRYEPTLNTVLTVRVAVKDREEVDFLGRRKSLLRVEWVPDKVVVPGHAVTPARSVWWLDEEFVPVRRQIELEGLGSVLLSRTTKEGAAGPVGTVAGGPDLGLRALVPLNRAIPRPYATRAALYRITLKDDPEPATTFANDTHQQVGNVKGNTFDVLVRPVRPGTGKGESERPGPEFTGSSYFLDADNERIVALAHKIVGAEKDPWKKALRIERWVKNSLRVDNAAPLVPASAVAANPRGDCRSAALLATALCRAEGIPARPAVGLLYVFKGKPSMGFHMWTEVWIDGRWLGIDGILGQGGVSAAHLKVADHSWHEARSLTPLLPASRILGKVSIEVVKVEAGE